MTRTFQAHIRPKVDMWELSRVLKNSLRSHIELREYEGIDIPLSKEYCQGVKITVVLEKIGRIKKVRDSSGRWTP